MKLNNRQRRNEVKRDGEDNSREDLYLVFHSTEKRSWKTDRDTHTEADMETCTHALIHRQKHGQIRSQIHRHIQQTL